MQDVCLNYRKLDDCQLTANLYFLRYVSLRKKGEELFKLRHE